jgi:hypothetical protein
MNAQGFTAVTMDEMMAIEGGLFGITWDDVKAAAKFVAGVIVTAVITKKI